MTTLEKINSLTWLRLKEILRELIGLSSDIQDINNRVDDIENAPSLDSRPYKVYTALLTQTGTSAPVPTVLENTLGGTVTFSYNGVGLYTATLTGAFINLKTTGTIQNGVYNNVLKAFRNDNNTVNIVSYGSTLVLENDVINGSTVLEIRVYN